MCQNCENYLSGNTCVDECPAGTEILNNITCSESLPPSPILNIDVLDSNNVDISWDIPAIPNGVITGYRLYQNNLMVVDEEVEYNGMTNPATLLTNYIATNLTRATYYNYTIQSKNSIGWGPLSNITSVRTQDGYPDSPLNLEFTNINSSQATLNWDFPVRIEGELTGFYYQLWINNYYNNSNNRSWNLLMEQEFNSLYNYHTFNGLSPYTQYRFRMKTHK